MERYEGSRLRQAAEHPTQKPIKKSHKPSSGELQPADIKTRIAALVMKQNSLKSDIQNVKENAGASCGLFGSSSRKFKKLNKELHKVEDELIELHKKQGNQVKKSERARKMSLGEPDKKQVTKILEKPKIEPSKFSLAESAIRNYAVLMNEGRTDDALLESQKATKLVNEMQDVNLKDEDGNTLLHLACNHKMQDLIKVLISKKADQNITNNDGDTPLMEVCKMDNFELADILLNASTEEPIKDKNSNTVLHILLNARFEKGEEKNRSLCRKLIGELLEKHPSLANAQNDRGSTPLMYALRNHDVRYAELLLQQPAFKLYQDIETDLDNNDITKLDNFLQKQPPPTNQEITELVDVLKLKLRRKQPLQGSWVFVDRLIKRYKQISIDFEHKPMPLFERFQMAASLEKTLSKVESVAKLRVAKSSELPRTMQIDEKGEFATFFAKRSISLASGEGASKRVDSAIRVPINDLSAKAELIVSATMKEGTEFHRDLAIDEYQKIAQFRGIDGIIQAYGVSYYQKADGTFKTKIMMEAFKGTLSNFNRSEGGREVLNFHDQLSVARKLTNALAEMHKMQMAHWDLKLSNILFRKESDGSINAKISDLGLCFDCSKSPPPVNGYGTRAFSPPELYYGIDKADTPEKCKQCDVWAYGVALFNLLSEKEFPDPTQMSYSEFVKKHEDLVAKPLARLEKIKKEDRTPEQAYKISVYSMLKLNANERPTTEQLQSLLSQID